MMMFARFAVVALLAAGFVTTDVNAQDTVPGSESFFVETRSIQVWTGRFKDASGVSTFVEPSKGYARQLRTELAAVQVGVDVDRKFAQARTQLDRLAVMATLRGYDERADVLVEVALVRASLLEKLGDSKAALDASKSVLLSSSFTSEHTNYEFTAADENDLKVDAKASRNPKLVALSEKLATPTSTLTRGNSDDQLYATVRVSVGGDGSVVAQLGARAVPSLVRMISEGGLDELPEKAHDPLRVLIHASSKVAAEFVLKNYDKGRDLWKTRVLGCLIDEKPFNSHSPDWTFSADDSTPPQLHSAWLPIVERLVEDPALMPDAVDLVEDLAAFDALTPRIQKALIGYLLSNELTSVRAVLGVCGRFPIGSSRLQILEAALSSAHAEVRARAATLLLVVPRSEVLLSSVDHSDPVVRAAVASSLGLRNLVKMFYRHEGSGGAGNYAYQPPIGPRERAILVRLAKDPNADVRLATANVLVKSRENVDADLMELLAADQDQRVRAAMLSAPQIGVDTIVRLATEFTTDPDSQRRSDVISMLTRVVVGTPAAPATAKVNSQLLAVIQMCFNDKDRASVASSSDLFQTLLQSKEGLTALLIAGSREKEVAAKRAGMSVTNRLLNHVAGQVKDTGQRARFDAAELRLDAEPGAWGAFVASLKSDEFRFDRHRLTHSLVTLRVDYSLAFFPLAEDEQFSLPFRLNALNVAAGHDDARTFSVLGELLRATGWVRADSGYNSLIDESFESIGKTLVDGKLSPGWLELINDARVPDWALFDLRKGFPTRTELTDEMTDAFLARWQKGDYAFRDYPFAALFENLGKRPRNLRGDWFEIAARNGISPVFRALGEMRDPAYLPLLSRALNDTDFSANSFLSASIRPAALEALTRYLDDRAADIILKATGTTPSAEFRQKCFEALDQIRKYQEEKGRWEGRRTSQQAKDEAVRDLVKLLDDSDTTVRAQSARSIATLGAVDQLPKLVAMLKDKDANVRKAVQDALDALNAATVKKP